MFIKLLKQYFSREKENNPSYIPWVDVAKGLAVLLAVLGHMWYVCTPRLTLNLIYSFHIPFFFMLSGFVFQIKDHNPLRFLKNRFFRIIIPLAFFILLAVIDAYTMHLSVYKDPKVAWEYFTMWNGEQYCNKPAWYFIVSLNMFIVMFFLNLPNQKWYVKLFFLFAFVILGYYIYSNKIFMPFGLNRMTAMASFFIVGSLLRDLYKFMPKRWYLTLPILLCAVPWVIFGGFLNGYVSVYSFNLSNYWYFQLSGLFGSITFMYLAFLISKVKFTYFINLWGKNSIFIMGTHFVTDFGPVWIFRNTMTRIGWAETAKASWLAIGLAIALLMAYIVVCFIVDCLVPWIAGKKEFFYTFMRNEIKARKEERPADC